MGEIIIEQPHFDNRMFVLFCQETFLRVNKTLLSLVEKSMLLIKVLSWIIALSGLWEFGDIAAMFVPDFGKIPAFVWNHIIIGLVLMIVGVWAALTSNPSIAKTMNWIAAGAGLWLMLTSFILRYPVINAGLWNDFIVGVIAFILGVWAALTPPQITD